MESDFCWRTRCCVDPVQQVCHGSHGKVAAAWQKEVDVPCRGMNDPAGIGDGEQSGLGAKLMVSTPQTF